MKQRLYNGGYVGGKLTEYQAKEYYDECKQLEDLTTPLLKAMLAAFTDDNFDIINAGGDYDPPKDMNLSESAATRLEEALPSEGPIWLWQINDQPYYDARTYREALIEAIYYERGI